MVSNEVNNHNPVVKVVDGRWTVDGNTFNDCTLSQRGLIFEKLINNII